MSSFGRTAGESETYYYFSKTIAGWLIPRAMIDGQPVEGLRSAIVLCIEGSGRHDASPLAAERLLAVIAWSMESQTHATKRSRCSGRPTLTGDVKHKKLSP